MSKINLPAIGRLDELVKMLSEKRKTMKETTIKVCLSENYKLDELKLSVCYSKDESMSVILTALAQIEGFAGIDETARETFDISRPVRLVVRPDVEGIQSSLIVSYFSNKIKESKEKIESHKVAQLKNQERLDLAKAKLAEETEKKVSVVNTEATVRVLEKALANSSHQIEPLQFLVDVIERFRKEFPTLPSVGSISIISPVKIAWNRVKLSPINSVKATPLVEKLFNYSISNILSNLKTNSWYVCLPQAVSNDKITPISKGMYKSQQDVNLKHHKKAIVAYNLWAPFFEMELLRFKSRDPTTLSFGVIRTVKDLKSAFLDTMDFLKKKNIVINYQLDLQQPEEVVKTSPKPELTEEEEEEEESSDDSSSEQSSSRVISNFISEDDFFLESKCPKLVTTDSVCAMVYRCGYWNLDVFPSKDKLGQWTEKAKKRMDSLSSDKSIKSSLFPIDWIKSAVIAVKTEDGSFENVEAVTKMITAPEFKVLRDQVQVSYDKWLKQQNVSFLEAFKMSVKKDTSVKTPVPSKPQPKAQEKKKTKTIKDDPNQLNPKESTGPKKPTKAPEPKPKASVQRKKGQSRVDFFGITSGQIEEVVKILQLESDRLPSWCITGIGRFGKVFISDLKAKKVSKDTFTQWSLQHSLPKKKNQTDVELAWSKVKTRFKGVPLVSNPSTPTERALLAEFKKFCKLYPHWKNKPKLGQGKRLPPEPKVPYGRVIQDPVSSMFGGEFMTQLKAFKELFQTMQSVFVISK